MQIVFSIAAILATWRLAELFTQDRLTESLRQRLPAYPWSCSRCMSVWSAIITAALWYAVPWVNVVLALAWLYLVHLDWVIEWRRRQDGRRLHISVRSDGQISIDRNDLGAEETMLALTTIVKAVRTPGPER